MTEFGYVVLGIVGGAILFSVALAVYVYMGRKSEDGEEFNY